MNVFPVTVVIDGEKTAKSCRAVWGPDGAVTVYGWSGGAAEVVAEGSGIEMTGARSWQATTSDGEILSLTRQGGCGCSHPLKRWSPPGARREHA